MPRLFAFLFFACLGGLLQPVWGQESLPVKISDFYAERHGINVHLVFITIDELNNKEFEIQRSEDGVQFVNVGIIAGHNNSAQVNNYEFTDEAAFETGITKYYYRLRQVDYDGGFTYSRIVVAQSPAPVLPATSLVIAPVPASDHVDITYSSPITDQVSLELVDWSGAVLRSASASPGATVTFDSLYELTTGPYLLRIMQADRILVRQIYVD